MAGLVGLLDAECEVVSVLCNKVGQAGVVLRLQHQVHPGQAELSK